MTTLATMKTRIADEIARTDLTTQIAEAITTAITEYQQEIFYFNETRDLTFTTVADQQFYDSTDLSDIPNLLKIDWMTILIANNDLRKLDRRDPEKMDYDAGNTSSTNQPDAYAYYQQKIRLYPIPSTSGWTVRLNAKVKKAAPATDEETDNIWMTDGELLIRSRAKFELSMHVTGNMDMAARMSPHEPRTGTGVGHAAWFAKKSLKNQTTLIKSPGRIKAYN